MEPDATVSQEQAEGRDNNDVLGESETFRRPQSSTNQGPSQQPSEKMKDSCETGVEEDRTLSTHLRQHEAQVDDFIAMTTSNARKAWEAHDQQVDNMLGKWLGKVGSTFSRVSSREAAKSERLAKHRI